MKPYGEKVPRGEHRKKLAVMRPRKMNLIVRRMKRVARQDGKKAVEEGKKES